MRGQFISIRNVLRTTDADAPVRLYEEHCYKLAIPTIAVNIE